MERPELYDLRLISGVVREDDGVEVFLGSIDGERDAARPAGISGCGVEVSSGIGGAF